MLVERDDGIGVGGHFDDYPDAQPPSLEPAPVTDAEAEEWRNLYRVATPLQRLLADRARDQARIRKYGNHAGSCLSRCYPHLHDGVECDEASLACCDCGWPELHRALLKEVPDAQA